MEGHFGEIHRDQKTHEAKRVGTCQDRMEDLNPCKSCQSPLLSSAAARKNAIVARLSGVVIVQFLIRNVETTLCKTQKHFPKQLFGVEFPEHIFWLSNLF